MSRPKNPIPSYLLHKTSGQARVRIKNGSRYQDIYLGEYGSPESLEKYHLVLAEHYGGNSVESPEPIPTFPSDPNDWTIAELVVKYDDFASTNYVKDGRPTDDRYRAAIQPLINLYGSTLAMDFGPKKLKALRESIIRRGNLRSAKFDNLGNLVKPGAPFGRG